MKRIIIILAIIVFSNNLYSQQYLSEKDAFAFFMKAYNHKPNDKTNVRVGHNPNYRWYDLYLYKFHNREYQQVKNDEFKIQKFANKILNELKGNINKADNNSIYYQTIEANLGKYNFSEGSFPIYYSMDKFKGVSGNLQGFRIKIGKILNDESFNASLRMNNNDAESFINKRKKNNGSVNRKVYLKFYFKVTEINTLIKSPRGGVNGYNKEDLTIEVTKIEIYGNEYYSENLGEIKIKDEKNDWLKSKLTSTNWEDINKNYRTKYNMDNTYSVKVNKDNTETFGTYRIINSIIVRKEKKGGLVFAYKLKVENNQLKVSGLDKFNKWKHYWTHNQIN